VKVYENESRNKLGVSNMTISLKIVQIKNGWAAVGNNWAVFGKTKEDVVNQFHESEKRHVEINNRLDNKQN